MKYHANPDIEVDAFKIDLVVPFGIVDGKASSLQLHLDNGWVRSVEPELFARMIPQRGDYYVIQADGYVYLNPKAVFERKWLP